MRGGARAPSKSLLLIEDNQGDVRLLREMLNEPGSHNLRLTHVDCLDLAVKHLAAHAVDLILLDLGLPDAEGLGAIRRARPAAPHVPLVVLTGLDDETLAAQALQEGAQDYLIKGQIDSRGLLRALRYASERKIMEEALFAEKERAQVTLNCIGDAVASTDIFGGITFLNLVAEQMLGCSSCDVAGQPLGDVFHIVDATNREPILNPIEMRAGEDRTVHLRSNCLLIRGDGSEVPIEDSVSTIRDRDGRPTGAVIVFRDVTASRTKVLQMTHSAQHDYLTGLPNRMLLNDRVTQAIASAQRHRKKVVVLFLDLDGFKYINDSVGHGVGDKLLQSIARRLVDCVRSSDTVTRQGGDEFVVLLSEVEHADDAAVAARKMLQAVSDGHRIDDHDLHITTSMGVSVYPDDGQDAETLIKNADIAMYQAKESGRQTYRFFKSAMNVGAAERLAIEDSLQLALERQEFTLHYQPKTNLATGLISGGEALLRWIHPMRGPLSPEQFIPIAEDCGLILPIGHWVLREACAQSRAWMDAGLSPGTMCVNISAREFRGRNFVDAVFTALDDMRLDPSALELELTESALMKHAESTKSVLKELRSKGVRVAIDDFGTGYSSLSYLMKFPIDTLKIDRSFISRITADPDECPVVSAVIGIGKCLKLTVVAEGVERREEVAFLRAHQCDEAQGYHYSPPVPPATFAKLLETGVRSR